MSQFAEAGKLLESHTTCVIATVGPDGRPEAATIGFSHDQNWTFFIGTSNNSRKYKNLKTNSKCALVFGFEGKQTIQLEGIAKEASSDEISARLPSYLEKVTAAKRFANEPGQRWFVINPNWMRYTDFSASQPIFETKDFS